MWIIGKGVDRVKESREVADIVLHHRGKDPWEITAGFSVIADLTVNTKTRDPNDRWLNLMYQGWRGWTQLGSCHAVLLVKESIKTLILMLNASWQFCEGCPVHAGFGWANCSWQKASCQQVQSIDMWSILLETHVTKWKGAVPKRRCGRPPSRARSFRKFFFSKRIFDNKYDLWSRRKKFHVVWEVLH